MELKSDHLARTNKPASDVQERYGKRAERHSLNAIQLQALWKRHSAAPSVFLKCTDEARGRLLGKRKMHAGASVDVAKQAPRMLKQMQENQSQQKEAYKEIRALDSFNTQLSYESLSLRDTLSPF